MRVQSNLLHQRAPRSHFVCVTLLLVCALLTHSLDNCAAHLDRMALAATGAPQMTTHCFSGTSLCEVCAPSDLPHQDACDLISETAVLNSSQHLLEYQAVTLAATVAVLPAMPQLIALSGCLRGRAGPPPTLPASVYLRSSRSSRAPPLSA